MKSQYFTQCEGFYSSTSDMTFLASWDELDRQVIGVFFMLHRVFMIEELLIVDFCIKYLCFWIFSEFKAFFFFFNKLPANFFKLKIVFNLTLFLKSVFQHQSRSSLLWLLVWFIMVWFGLQIISICLVLITQLSGILGSDWPTAVGIFENVHRFKFPTQFASFNGIKLRS